MVSEGGCVDYGEVRSGVRAGRGSTSMASGGLDATARVKLTAKQGYRTATAHLTKAW